MTVTELAVGSAPSWSAGDNSSSISPRPHNPMAWSSSPALPRLPHTRTHGHVPELTTLQTQEQRGITSLTGEIRKAFGVPEELVLHVLELQSPLQPVLLQ